MVKTYSIKVSLHGGLNTSALFLLGRALDLLPVLQPFHLDVGVEHLTGQHDLLALLHRVAGLHALQEGCGEERGGYST